MYTTKVSKRYNKQYRLINNYILNKPNANKPTNYNTYEIHINVNRVQKQF